MSRVSSHSFLFIGGLHRSGTSLVADWLAEHRSISRLSGTGVPEDEGQHLQSIYPTAGGLGGAGRFGNSSRAHLTDDSELVTPRTRDALLDSWSPFWDMGKPMLLEKSPPNVLRTRFLQALFPDAYFVMVIRHPVAVAYATQRWFRRGTRALAHPVHSQVRHWATCYETLEVDAPHLRRLLVTRYEDLVADPGRELSRLFAFLELEPTGGAHVPKPGLNEKYFERWMSRRNPLRRAYVNAVTKRLDPRVNRLGYSLSCPQPVAPDPEKAAKLPMSSGNMTGRRTDIRAAHSADQRGARFGTLPNS